MPRRGFIRLLGLGSVLFALMAPLRADNCSATQSAPLGPSALQWRKWELPLTGSTNYLGPDGKGNPQRDLILQVTFTKCGVSNLVRYWSLGFWYGLAADGQTLDNTAFRIRTALPAGTWQWELSCTKRSDGSASTPTCTSDAALNRKGRFQVNASSAGNYLYKNGFLQTSTDGRYLTAGPNKRFFWLGDTVWNANLLMTYANWQAYINDRAAPTAGTGSQFSVVQLATAPKALGSTDTSGNPPFDPTNPACSGDGPGSCFRWNPRFWKGVDDKIEYANQNGIVVLLVGFIEPLTKSAVLGASTVATDPSEAKIFAQSVAARYSGNFVIYSPGFDHKLVDNSGIINTVGSALGNDTPTWTSRQLVTNHSAGGSDVSLYTQYLQRQPWLDFELYQSGTPGNSQAEELFRMTDRASSMAGTLYAASPTMPVINGESVYPGQQTWILNHTPYRARQTAYLSMLSGAMGYTMGTCGVVDWGLGNGTVGCNNSPPWTWTSTDPAFTATTMKAMKSIMQSIFWERLKPEPSRIQLLTGQPAFTADTKSVLAYDGSSAILAYLPRENMGIRINFNSPRAVPRLANAQSWPTTWAYTWLSPRTGGPKPTNLFAPAPVKVQNGVFDFMKPNGCDISSQPGCDALDWVLKITDKTKVQPGPDSAVLQVANELGPVSGDVRIVSQVMNAVGNPSNELEIGGTGLKDLSLPRLAAEPAGNCFVVWAGDSEDGATVRGRVLDEQGNPVTQEIVIATGDAAAPGHPFVVTLANGSFLVTWSGWGADGSGPFIRYRIFDRLGSPLTPPTAAMDCAPVAGDFPQATSLSWGGFVIAWEMSDGAGIHVLQLDSLGNSVGEMDLAQGTGTFPVLETLVDQGFAPGVSYGLYRSDGSSLGGDSLTVTTSPGFCR